MADIDIGSPAITGDGGENGTIIYKGNPANASGKITSVEIYVYSTYSLVDCEVATFYVESGNNLSTRDSEVIGAVASGAKRTIAVNLDVVEGDYIGITFTSGYININSTGGDGIWFTAGDKIPSTNQSFSVYADYRLSLYGTGTIPPSVYYGYNSS